MSDLDPPASPPPAADGGLGLGGGSLDPDAFNLKGGSKARTPMIIGIVVLLLGGGGFLFWRIKSGHEHDKKLAAFMSDFQQVEEQEVGPFWICLLGKDGNPSAIPDNLALQARLDSTFMSDPENYPAKVIENCAPRLRNVGSKVDALEGPAEFKELLDKYKKAVDQLGPGAAFWAEQAKKRIAVIKADKEIDAAITAFHAVSGTPAPEAIAYDRFLRCAVPEADKIKDSQALLQHLFEECKKPEYGARVRADCAKLAGAKDGKVDKNFKATLKKYGADDRDSSAWTSCLRKARKGAKVDDMAQFGQAFVGYLGARSEVRKQGAEMLKKE